MNTTRLISVACFSAFTLIAGLSLSQAQASTSSKLFSCNANSKQKVIDCCQHVLQTNKRPYWMSSGRGACSAAVTCVGGAKPLTVGIKALVVVPPKCKIAVPEFETKSSTPAETKSVPKSFVGKP